jgi:hypothetical protein
MELFGLVLALPILVALSAGYAFFVRLVIAPRPRLAGTVRLLSLLPVVLVLAELILVASVGAVRVRQVVGPIFPALHAVFLLIPPSLANLILLPSRSRSLLALVAAVSLSFVAGFGLILFNIAVSEALYGVDGIGGPYGQPLPVGQHTPAFSPNSTFQRKCAAA